MASPEEQIQLSEDEGFLQTTSILAVYYQPTPDAVTHILAAETRAKDFIESPESSIHTLVASRNLGHIAALRTTGLLDERE